MKTNLFRLVAGVFTATIVTVFGVLQAAEFPAPSPSVFTIKNFKFQSGETLAELKIHYVTIGDPKNEAGLVLHGTTGSAANVTAQSFGGELFGVGQPLDATRYFFVIPDLIGTGKSSKPFDGLKTQFAKYYYVDTVEVQHRLIAEHLGIKRLRLVIGKRCAVPTGLIARLQPFASS
jgi:homoserine O-acetyltransferase/O-succinyltransferase